MTSKKTNLILIAQNNALILRWWADVAQVMKQEILAIYAARMGWPVDEVDPDMNSPQDLEYLAKTYKNTLILFAEDCGL